MAPTRGQNKERQFKRRGGGVMKKADAVHSLIPDIKAAVLFLDGTDLWTYESEEGWVSSIASMANLRLERMNPSHFRTVFEHQQALARASESAIPDAGSQSLPLPPPALEPTPEPTLFVSPSAQGASSSPSTDEMTRLLLSDIQSVAPINPIAQRRSTRTRKPIARGTINANTNKRRVGDIYGFIDVDNRSLNEMLG